MPRPKRPGAPAPKPRSRHGCWPCKRRKIKCDEEKPACSNCLRQGDTCDYSIRLNWEGRTKRKAPEPATPGSNSEFVSYQTNFQQSPLISGPDLASPVEVHGTAKSEWSVASSPYANNAGNIWISRATPVSPPSISAKSPAGSDEHSIASISHTISTENPNVRPMAERVMPSPEFGSSLLAHDTTRSSQAYPFPGSSEFDSAGLSFNPLSSFSFETNSVSQPVSFLRDSSAVEVVTSQNSSYRAKRYKRHDGDADHQHHESAADEMTSPSLGQDIDRTFENSLLSHTIFGMSPPIEPEKRQPVVSGHEIFYGFDCGSPDFDLNKNNDSEAIAPISPSEEAFADDDTSPTSEQTPIGSLHVRRRSSFTTGGGYYVTPVRVKIPRRMTPLPKLLDNPMNLLYFHHFIDHTARILVPHDCDQNAFLKVLPAMAITDPNLLNLMLAYSASHRARFLRYPEPSNRIAHWVRDVFPTLRHALTEPEEKVTDSHLATAVMLLSLKIVSPNTFEAPITWQTHLKLARDLFEACGIQHRAQPDNKVAYFLAHWFGYLDIFGSLSCRSSGPPLLQTNDWSASTVPWIPHQRDGYQDFDDNDDNSYRVDCFYGYTPRTGAHLTRLAHLTHYCEKQRFDDEAGNFLPHWTPSEDVIEAGNALLEDMHRIRQRGHVLGTHHTELEDNEMIAIDLAFHWSAVVHIHRRVLGSSTYSTEVREAVNHLCSAIARIRSGSSTECSVLFPLFTAGCESRDPQQRLEMMTRVMNFEAEGLKQFKNARKLMQRCWEEDLPWMALAHGEFLG